MTRQELETILDEAGVTADTALLLVDADMAEGVHPVGVLSCQDNIAILTVASLMTEPVE